MAAYRRVDGLVTYGLYIGISSGPNLHAVNTLLAYINPKIQFKT